MRTCSTWNYPRIPCRGSGNKVTKSISFFAPRTVQLMMLILGENSAKTCRHAPHGITGSSESDTIIMAWNSLSPCCTAFPTQTRSAHIVSPKEIFSTLQPAKIRPETESKAAPTKNFEYGAYAHARAWAAISRSESFINNQIAESCVIASAGLDFSTRSTAASLSAC